MRSSIIVFHISLLALVRSDPVEWLIFSNSATYVSSPIGFGPGGGLLKVNLSLNQFDNNPASSVLSVLSESQLQGWQNTIDDFRQAQPNVLVSTHFASFEKELNISLPLTNAAAERFFLVLTFPNSKPDDVDVLAPSGRMNVDWEQNDGSFIQYQFVPLANAMQILRNLVLVFTALYGIHLIGNFRTVSGLHYFYVFVLCFASLFLQVWIRAIQAESSTGQRLTWETRISPSLMEKIFDALEVLVYLLSALGWKTLRSSLSVNEIKTIGAVSVLSLALGGAEVACGDDEAQCGSYTSARMLLHMFGFLTAIIAFTSHVVFLSAHLGESSIASPETGVMYVKLSQFRWFRLIFIVFIVQPTVAVMIRADILDWFDDWLFLTIFWATKLMLISAVAVVFRPLVPRMSLVDLAIKQRQIQQQS